MSHRVTTQTEIKDKALAMAALKQAGFSYAERGDTLTITSGELSNASIDLRTGTVSGDTDYGHRAERFGALRQFYSEASYKAGLNKNGGYVESREVDKNGDIILMCAIN